MSKVVTEKYARQMVAAGKWRADGVVGHDGRRYVVYSDLSNQKTRHSLLLKLDHLLYARYNR